MRVDERTDIQSRHRRRNIHVCRSSLTPTAADTHHNEGELRRERERKDECDDLRRTRQYRGAPVAPTASTRSPEVCRHFHDDTFRSPKASSACLSRPTDIAVCTLVLPIDDPYKGRQCPVLKSNAPIMGARASQSKKPSPRQSSRPYIRWCC